MSLFSAKDDIFQPGMIKVLLLGSTPHSKLRLDALPQKDQRIRTRFDLQL